MRPRHGSRAALLAALCFIPAFAPAEVVDIGNDKLQALIADGVPVIDVRRADEWHATGVIEGSHLVTFFDETGAYDKIAWKRAVDEIVAADEPVVLICRTGRRTELVSRWLDKAALHRTVYNVRNGIVSWTGTGGETVTAVEPTDHGASRK